MIRPRKPEFESMSSINLTSMIDILMVLLIVFMMAETAGSQWGFNMKLPNVVAVERTDDPSILISYSNERRLFVTTASQGDQEVQRENLRPILARLGKQYGYKQVIIKADRRLKYKEIISIMDDSKKAGFTNISLATEM